jgi:hypothetical protein
MVENDESIEHEFTLGKHTMTFKDGVMTLDGHPYGTYEKRGTNVVVTNKDGKSVTIVHGYPLNFQSYAERVMRNADKPKVQKFEPTVQPTLTPQQELEKLEAAVAADPMWRMTDDAREYRYGIERDKRIADLKKQLSKDLDEDNDTSSEIADEPARTRKKLFIVTTNRMSVLRVRAETKQEAKRKVEKYLPLQRVTKVQQVEPLSSRLNNQQNVSEGQYRGQYDTKEEAIAYAKEKIKTYRDPDAGIEIWEMPSGRFDVVNSMNSLGRYNVIDNGGKYLGTIEHNKGLEEGAKVDRMVKHIKSGEKKAGYSDKDAESIAWATANKRGYLDNKNKKKHVEEADRNEMDTPEFQAALARLNQNAKKADQLKAKGLKPQIRQDKHGRYYVDFNGPNTDSETSK